MIYHIVLFKLKPNTTDAQIEELRSAGAAMVGVIPGLKSFEMGAPLASTAHRAQGFNMGLITVMDTEEQVLAYGAHEAHQRVHKIREAICDDTLAYDMVV